MRTSPGSKLQKFLSGCAAGGVFLGLIALGACDRSELVTTAAPTPAGIPFGTKINFGEGGNSEPYKVSGWSKTEAKFTWSEGTSARLKIPITATNDSLSLKMTIAALIKPPELPFQPVEVYANGQKIAEWQVGDTAEFVGSIPAEMAKLGGFLNVEFQTPKATSPKTLGLSADTRTLGICCLNLEISKG